jgi:hypothetical protein
MLKHLMRPGDSAVCCTVQAAIKSAGNITMTKIPRAITANYCTGLLKLCCITSRPQHQHQHADALAVHDVSQAQEGASCNLKNW